MKWLSRLPVTEEIAGSSPVGPATKLTYYHFCGSIFIYIKNKMSEITDKTAELDTTTSPGLRFVYCEHTPENVPAIINELSGADTVALEFVGGTVEQRELIESLANTVTHADTSPAQNTDEALSLLEKMDGTPEESFVVGIITHLKGSGKKMRLIDMPFDDLSDTSLFMREHEVNEKLRNAMSHLGLSSVEEAFISKLTLDSEFTISREKLVEGQLIEIRQAKPNDTIAVIAGSFHTPISDVSAKTQEIEQVIIENGAPTVEVALSPLDDAIRMLSTSPDKNLDEATMKRALLEMLTMQYNFDNAATRAAQESEDTLDDAIETALKEIKRRHAFKRLGRTGL